jgi:nucleoid-associated protein YgaU
VIIKYGSNARYSLSGNKQEAYRKKTDKNVVYTTYVAKQGDSFDLLAHRLLRDFSRYWEIADLNPHVKFPNKLEVGQIIRIPR